jgi:hypothetical protein
MIEPNKKYFSRMGNQSEISSEAFSARELPKKRSRSRSVLIVGQGTDESWLLIVPAHSTPRDAADAATTTSIPVVTPSLARPRVDARRASPASTASRRTTTRRRRGSHHQVRSIHWSHTTASAMWTPILKDFARRISPPIPPFQSPSSAPFNSN